MIENLVIVPLSELGILAIGKLLDGKLIEPRAIFEFQGENRAPMIGVRKLLGQPKFLTLPKNFYHYTPADKAVIDLYIKDTTSIVLASGTEPRKHNLAS